MIIECDIVPDERMQLRGGARGQGSLVPVEIEYVHKITRVIKKCWPTVSE